VSFWGIDVSLCKREIREGFFTPCFPFSSPSLSTEREIQRVRSALSLLASEEGDKRG